MIGVMEMETLKEGYTVLKQAEVSFEEKKSIFICNIKRVGNEKEAMEFINSIKLKYKDATHNVFAYITNNSISMRYSDDGEPQGTAGPPMLEVLKREGINDVAAVVTRYFGGTLLGAGGLIRAYSSSCKQGVDAAVKVKTIPAVLYRMEFEYDMYGRINNYYQGKNVIVKNTEFLERVSMDIMCSQKDYEKFHSDVIEMMNGKDCFTIVENLMCFVDGDGKLMED